MFVDVKFIIIVVVVMPPPPPDFGLNKTANTANTTTAITKTTDSAKSREPVTARSGGGRALRVRGVSK